MLPKLPLLTSSTGVTQAGMLVNKDTARITMGSMVLNALSILLVLAQE